MDRFKNCDLTTGSVSLWAVFEVSKPHTIPSSFSLFLVGGGSSQLLLLPSLPPAAMIPCHDALFSLWNYKPRLPSRSCLAHGVLSEIRKVANTPAYRLSSMGKKKDEHPICQSQCMVNISLPCNRRGKKKNTYSPVLQGGGKMHRSWSSELRGSQGLPMDANS